MLDERYIVYRLSLQDRDLLARLTTYAEGLESRVREGQGWLVFNADEQRAARAERVLRGALVACRPFISSLIMPWRDFALNAYMEIELQQQGPQIPPAADDPRHQAYDIAQRVARDTLSWLRHCDLLLLRGVAPAHRHQLDYLERVIAARYERRLATLLLTPQSPEGLAAACRALDPSTDRWSCIYRRLSERCLIAA